MARVGKRSYKRRPESVLAPAREAATRYFNAAATAFTNGDKALARRKVRAARRALMKVQLRLPAFKDSYCRRCNSFLQTGVNARVRLKDGVRVRTCLECNAVSRRRVKRS